MQVSEQCDRCRRVYTQDVGDGATVRSSLTLVWDICRLFGPNRDSPVSPERVRAEEEAVASGRQAYSWLLASPKVEAYRVIAPSARICRDCVDDYRNSHAAFLTDWFTSCRQDAPAETTGPEGPGRNETA